MHSGKGSIEDRRNTVAPGDLQGSSIEHSVLHMPSGRSSIEDRRNKLQDHALTLEDNLIGLGVWSLPMVLHGRH